MDQLLLSVIIKCSVALREYTIVRRERLERQFIQVCGVCNSVQ